MRLPWSIEMLMNDPPAFLVLVGLLLYSVIFHETAHGWMALAFGDTTAKQSGRLSLNPATHIDPLGTIMLFVVGFGWARPVPVNFRNFKQFRLGLICVALAGCMTNIAIATVAFAALKIIGPQEGIIPSVLFNVARINLILGSFNLLPIPPLDGSKILMGFLPAGAQTQFARVEPYGFLILIGLIFTGMLWPMIEFMMGLILSVIGLII